MNNDTTILTNIEHDTHPAIEFLLSIGYQIGDKVSGRCLGDRNRDYWGTLTETNIDLYEYKWEQTGKTKADGKPEYKAVRDTSDQYHHPDGLRWLAEINLSEHSQVYFNVNGGRNKLEVTKAYACFFESDSGDFDQQWEIINSLPIKPSAVVRTRKSLHTYFTLLDNTLSEWVERQQRVIFATQSDPAIKNIDRLMRLPGFYHCKEIDGQWDYILCTLEVATGTKYQSAEIDGAIATLGKCEYSEPRFKLYQYLNAKLNNHQGQDYSLINIDDVFTTPDHDFDNYDLRAREYCRRVLGRFNGGKDTPEPADAFTEPVTKLKKSVATSKIKTIKLPSDAVVNSGGCSTLTDYLASKYAVGYDPAGRGEFATAQCPVHGGPGHSLNSLHIHRTTGAIICHGGCEAKEVIGELRERAKLADDPLWNVRELPGEAPPPEPEAEPLPPLDYKGDVLLISSDKSQADIYLPTGYIGAGKFEAVTTELRRYRAIAKNQLFRLNKKQLKALCKQHGVKNYSKLTLLELIDLPELNALDLSQEKNLFDNVICTIKIKIDHPNRLFIANQINKINSPLRDPYFIPFFSFDKLPNAPYIKAVDWEQNHPDAMEQKHKIDNFELWKKLTTFTPHTDKIDHVRYIGDSELFKGINLLNGRVNMLCGGLGGGKTTDFLDKAEAILGSNGKAGAINHATLNPVKILVLSYRRNLVANTASKAKHRRINGVIEMEQFKNKYSKFNQFNKFDPLILFACVDSLPKIMDRLYDGWWHDFIIIFDEADAVISHTEAGSTCRDKRNIILNSLDFILKNCLGIYALSGTLSDTTKDFFNGLGRPVDCYENTYTGPLRPLQFCLGTGDFSGKTKILDLDQRAINESLEEILRLVGEGERLLIVSDSQKRIEEIEMLINDNYEAVKMLRITAVTRSMDEYKDAINKIMSDPSYIYKNDYQVILYNSSAESGIDITFPVEYQQYFKKIFCYSFSVIGCNAIIQLLRRYRHECEVFLWSVTSSKYAPPVLPPDAELWGYMDELKSIESDIDLVHQPHSKHLELKKKLDFISAYEKSNPRICLVETLTKHGYDVTWHYLNESDTNTKEQREKVETQLADHIFNAENIYIGKDLSQIKEDDSTTFTEKMALNKAWYIKNFGYSADDYFEGKTKLFTQENIRYIEFRERLFFKYVRNNCCFDLPEDDLKLLQRDNYRGNTYLGDINLLYAPMHSLHRLHIEQLLNIEPIEEGKTPFISLSDKYFDKVKYWASEHQQKWEILCGSKYSERYFIFQLKKIIKKYFGVKSYVKEGNLYLIYDPLQSQAKPLIAKQIDDRIFKIKTFKYLADNTKYSEVATDPRFADVAKNFIRYESEPAPADELITEIRERAIAPVAVVVEQTQQQQPGTEPEPIPPSQPAIAPVATPATIYQSSEVIANPADLIQINGIAYLLGEVVKVDQRITTNTSINLPAGLGSRIYYDGLTHIATAVNDAEIIYKNDFDYWCIAYNPTTNTARRYNSLLSD